MNKKKLLEGVNERLLKGAQKIGELELMNIFSKWPPRCIGIVHQPQRPLQKKER